MASGSRLYCGYRLRSRPFFSRRRHLVDSAGHMPCSSRHGDRHQTGYFVMPNVGSTERFVRLGPRVVAAIAAARAWGWSHAALNTVATAGLITG